ncbi:MAG: FecR domain-containing protein [Polyangiaceae bacterium]
MSLERSPEEQALARLILDVREQPFADLDWERIEARLMRESRPERASRAVSFTSRWRLAAAGLLTAAAVASVVSVQRSKSAPPVPVPVARVSAGPLNGDQLALGAHITAGNQPLVVEHAGRARWTLEPHATAVVADAGEFLTLRLEGGALSAQVAPNPKLETFAVEVGGTRVAVHGTAFRVERAGERVLVAVSEGTVAVEPTGTHAAPAFLLRRNSRGNFALDGHTGTVEGNASAVVSDSGAQSHREVASSRALPARSPAPVAHSSDRAAAPARPTPAPVSATRQTPLQPSISEIETGVTSALDLMNGCFRDKAKSSGVRVSASTGLTLSVTGEGAVRSVTFAPPLAPAVEDCAVSGLRTLTFAHSVEGVTFTRVFELSR